MKVYVCVTLYHVYVSLLMIFSEGADRKRNIVFLNANNEKVYKQYCYIADQLKKNGFVCDVRLRTLKSELIGREAKKNKHQLDIVNNALTELGEKEFTLINFAWNNSYVYPSVGLLYKKAKDAVFVEESTLIAKLGQEKAWKKIIHRIMGDAVDFYKDKKVMAILVQKPELFPTEWQSKIQQLAFDSYLKKIDGNQVNLILNIMSEYGKNLTDLLTQPDIGIVYTCPFSEQNVISEAEKIAQIITICDYYKQYGNLVLKLHPRDETRYPVDESVTILPSAFPSELISLTGYQFKFAVSVCSSAVNTTNAEYKINMNENFYNDPVFILKDINGCEVKG